MLRKYLIEPPTITERLSLLTSPKHMIQMTRDKPGKTKEFLDDWQASWEKKNKKG